MKTRFKVGDIVTRDGSDRQRVVSVDGDWGTMVVECIEAPESRWCRVGDREDNLQRRYQLIASAAEDNDLKNG